MIYTIATLEEHNMGCGNLSLNIDVSGNKYLVGLYNSETKEYTHKIFDTMDEAFSVFSQLSEWIVRSYYSEEQKRNYLLTSSID